MSSLENRCKSCHHIHLPGEAKCGWVYALKGKVCTCMKRSLSNMNNTAKGVSIKHG